MSLVRRDALGAYLSATFSVRAPILSLISRSFNSISKRTPKLESGTISISSMHAAKYTSIGTKSCEAWSVWKPRSSSLVERKVERAFLLRMEL